MAEDNQDEEARKQLEEYQRQQAAAAIAASRNQPNAIPNEPKRAVDLTVGQQFTARGLPTPDTVIAPTSNIGQQPTPEQQQQLGIGYHVNQFGDNLGPTHDLSGYPNPSPQGSVGVQGIVSPQEQAFWAANPLGAVPHPVTGELIGLGDNIASRQKALESTSPPDQVAASRLPPPDFAQVPEIDPALIDRRNQIASEIDATKDQLRGASTQRARGQASQYDILNQKLNTLYHANTALATEHLRQSEQQTHAADQNRKMQEQYNVNRDATAAQVAMSRITAQPGTDEYKKSIANIALSYPHAVKDQRVEEALIKASTFHDERATIAQKAQEAGLTEQIVGYGQKGPTIKYVPGADVQQNQEITKATQHRVGKDFADSGLTPEQFGQRTEVVGVDKDGKQVSNPTHVKVAIGDGNFRITKEAYERMNKAYPTTQPNPAAPTASPQQSTGVQPNMDTQGLKISSDAEFHALPSGSLFIDPNGVKRRKP